jgi:hypothetical protein
MPAETDQVERLRVLTTRLRSGDSRLRRGAIQELLFRPGEEILTTVTSDLVFSCVLDALAGDDDPQVRWCSAHVLADLVFRMPRSPTIDHAAMTQLKKAARDPNVDIRCLMATVFDKLRHQTSEANAVLQVLSEDHSETVRNAARRLLQTAVANGT